MKLKNAIILMLSISFLIGAVLIFSVKSFADKKDENFSVFTEKIPEGAVASVRENAHIYVSGLYEMYYFNPSVEGFSIDPEEELKIGNGFYKYHLDEDGSLWHDEVVFFPIIQDDSVICFIIALWSEEASDWIFDCNVDIAPMIQEMDLREGIVVFDACGDEYYVSGKEVKLVAEAIPLCATNIKTGESTLVSTKIDSRIALQMSHLSENFDMAIGKLKNLVYQDEMSGWYSFRVNSPATWEGAGTHSEADEELSPSLKTTNMLTSGPNGFSINQPDYKVFNTDYCLVLQKDPDGTVRGMCWAAACATMIRYRTGNHTLESFQIADANGIDHDAGVLPPKAKEVLHDYGEIQYAVRWFNGAMSQTEVRHNINNQYPIYMDAGYYTSPVTGTFHANTIVGYQVINGTMTLRSWDSALNNGNGAFRSTTYVSSTGTYYYMNGHNMYWTRSVLIKLN